MERMRITFSMAFTRSKAQNKVSDKGIQIRLHLIKILKWNDPINYDKHLDDINNWLYEIADIRLKSDGKNPTIKNYLDWLFGDRDLQEDTNYTINMMKSNYGGLKERMSDTEVHNYLHRLYRQLSNDLGTRRFEGIQKYLD
jgi:hypothetical protein